MSLEGSPETPSEWTFSPSGGADRKFSLHSYIGRDNENCIDGDEKIPRSASYTSNSGIQTYSHKTKWQTQQSQPVANVMVTQATVDVALHPSMEGVAKVDDSNVIDGSLRRNQSSGLLGEDVNGPDCPSPASSMGGTYTVCQILVSPVMKKYYLFFYYFQEWKWNRAIRSESNHTFVMEKSFERCIGHQLIDKFLLKKSKCRDMSSRTSDDLFTFGVQFQIELWAYSFFDGMSGGKAVNR